MLQKRQLCRGAAIFALAGGANVGAQLVRRRYVAGALWLAAGGKLGVCLAVLFWWTERVEEDGKKSGGM